MISVAMCTYNGSKYLEEQLNSIIHQTRQPDEIVICDDRSKDDSIEIAQRTLENWNGIIRIVRNEKNLGFVKNFEKAISFCHGDIIFLSDQDDVWKANKIEVIVKTFEKNPDAAMVFHDSELVDKNLHPLFPSFWRNTLAFDHSKFLARNYKKLCIDNIIQGSACAFRRKVFELAVPFPEPAYHDEWLGLVALLIGEIIPVNKCLMQYRQDQNALGGLPTKKTFKDKVKKIIFNFSDEYSSDKKIMQRKEMVLSEFLRKYSEDSDSQFLYEIAQYYPFLKARIAFVCGQASLKVIDLSKYFRYTDSPTKALKMFSKDCIEFVYSKFM